MEPLFVFPDTSREGLSRAANDESLKDKNNRRAAVLHQREELGCVFSPPQHLPPSLLSALQGETHQLIYDGDSAESALWWQNTHCVTDWV